MYVYARGKSHTRLHIIRSLTRGIALNSVNVISKVLNARLWEASLHELTRLLSDVRHIARTARGLQRSTSLKGVCQSTNYSTWVCVCTNKASCDTRPNVKDIHEKHCSARTGYAPLMSSSRPDYAPIMEVDPYRPSEQATRTRRL